MTPAWGSHLRMHNPSTCIPPLEWSWPSHLSAPLQAQPLQLKIMCADEHASAGGIVQTNQTLGHPSADGFHAGTRRHP